MAEQWTGRVGKSTETPGEVGPGGSCTTEEVERMNKIAGYKLRFLQETFRRKVIAIAPRWNLLDFDQSFVDAPPQIGIDQADGDSKFTRQTALRDVPALNCIE